MAERAKWLGDVAPLAEEWTAHFVPEFRCGFVASAQVGLTTLRERGADVRRCCPAFQKLIVLGTLGRGKELASCEALAGVPEVVLSSLQPASRCSFGGPTVREGVSGGVDRTAEAANAKRQAAGNRTAGHESSGG
jgi:hypothetical protein